MVFLIKLFSFLIVLNKLWGIFSIISEIIKDPQAFLDSKSFDETNKIVGYLKDKYPVEIDVKLGMQPVYSYIIGVE